MIKAILLSILLSLTGVAIAAKDEPPIRSEALYNYACEYVSVMYGVSCDGIAAPTIVTSRIVDSRYYGLRYAGESFVFINKRLWLHDKAQWETTVVHETVHYILDYANANVTRCESEEYARRAHHSFEGTRYDDSWRANYKC